MMHPEIERHRVEITRIDGQLLALLVQRLLLGTKIARAKAVMGLPMRDVAREAEVLPLAIKSMRECMGIDPGSLVVGLNEEDLQQIFDAIMATTRLVQYAHLEQLAGRLAETSVPGG